MDLFKIWGIIEKFWCQTILEKHLTLIYVKFPKRPFESQKVAAADGLSKSLRFIRPLFLTFQKYIVVTFEFLLPATCKVILRRVTGRLHYIIQKFPDWCRHLTPWCQSWIFWIILCRSPIFCVHLILRFGSTLSYLIVF
jgi:hypothetical protein